MQNVRIFRSLEELSTQAANVFAELAGQRAAEDKLFVAALSGGSTPEPLYELLATPEFSTRLPWNQIHLFQVDERCVPPDHPDSNYGMIQQALLNRVPLPTENFHRMQAERADLPDAAKHYVAEIASVLAPPAGEWPRFDLILLGIGPDGHTASLFPGSAALSERSKWVVPNYVERLRTHRLTLTFPVINAAAEIIFLVSGDDKAQSLKRALEPEPGSRPLPAQQIRPQNGRLRWFVERSAARLLAAV